MAKKFIIGVDGSKVRLTEKQIKGYEAVYKRQGKKMPTVFEE